MEILCISLLILWVVALALVAYSVIIRLEMRNREVAKFRLKLLDLTSEYFSRHTKDPDIMGTNNPYYWFLDKYTYNDMFRSKKPLVLEEWYTEDEITKIMN